MRAEPAGVCERAQVLHACHGDIVVLVSDGNALEGKGAIYKRKFWPYPTTGMLVEHPNGGYISEIHINNIEAFMDELRLKKANDKTSKQDLKYCLERVLGFT